MFPATNRSMSWNVPLGKSRPVSRNVARQKCLYWPFCPTWNTVFTIHFFLMRVTNAFIGTVTNKKKFDGKTLLKEMFLKIICGKGFIPKNISQSDASWGNVLLRGMFLAEGNVRHVWAFCLGDVSLAGVSCFLWAPMQWAQRYLQYST